MAESVEIILRLLQVRQFVQGADQASHAIGGVGTAAEKSGKQAGISWKSVAKWGGAAGAVYGATKFVKGAIGTTEDLAKSSMALNRTTGMSIQTSGEWAAVLKTRGIDAKVFQRGLVTLSKQMTATNTAVAKSADKTRELNAEYAAVKAKGGKGAAKALEAIQKKIVASNQKGDQAVSMWKTLGVSMDAVRSGNTQKVLSEVSTGLSKIKNPALRAALAQKLLSKSSIALAPILFKGGQAIRDQLKVARKYVDFHGKTAKQVAEEAQHQRELKLAYMGVQVALGQALLPVMLSVSQIILKIVNVLQPFIRRGWVLKGMILALVAAFVAYKGILIAARIATAVATIQQIELNVAMDANPIGLVIIAIGALVIAIVLLWKKCSWFRSMVYAVWGALKTAFNWAKKNWPLLVAILGGPFTLAAEQIWQHWDGIKKLIGGVVDWAKKKLGELWDFIVKLPEKLISAVKKLPGGGFVLKALSAAAGIVGGAKSAVSSAYHALPFTQHGGTIMRAGHTIVGEAGPEIVRLPVAAQVLPLTHAAIAGAAGDAVIHTHVFLDRRQIAEAVGRYTADKAARR
jgi:hypothetical protein